MMRSLCTDGRKSRNVRLTWLVLAAALLGAIAALLMWARNDKYEFYRKKDFTPNGRTNQYSEGVPLEEMNFNWYSMPASAAPLRPDLVIELPLPCDVRYYTHQGDGEPALTLSKGTEVFVYPSMGGVEYGYGTVSWPSYTEGWRYAHPFAVEDVSDCWSDTLMYFVRLSELEQVSRSVLEANRKAEGRGRVAQMVWMQTRSIDAALYRHGIFCSEDLERMFLW